jgi:hypothetical protein
MKGSNLSRNALSMCGLIVILAGCGGSQAQFAAPVQGGAVRSAPASRADSRITRDDVTTEFTVKGRTILLGGKPFFVKGVDYMPTQIANYPDPNPLDDANSQVWTPDLNAMRAAGVNAVKVYNVTLTDFEKKYNPPLSSKLNPGETGKIGEFLKKAWNGGNKPIYVVLCIFFGGADVLDSAKVTALKGEYEEMATAYAGYPALMGITIGAEINSIDFVSNASWWKNLNTISDSITKGYKAGNAKKLITTTMVDFVRCSNGADECPLDQKIMPTVVQGTKNGFKIDAWGLDAYRGHTFTNMWDQLKKETTKPEIMAEYGAPASYYLKNPVTYDITNFTCKGFPDQLPDREAARQLPENGNPKMGFLVTYVTDNANELFANWANKGGVGSGGFYFEWNDEWYKTGWPYEPHIGGGTDGVPKPNAPFPGCYWDESWFGLNSDSLGSPNPHIPRPTVAALKALWAKQ